MYKDINFSIKGIVPIMLHNPQLANPRNPIVRQIKQITSKKQKTDEDLELLSALEWIGGLYTSESGSIAINGNQLQIEGFGKVVIPGENIEACVAEAAKKTKQGKVIKAAVLSNGPWELKYPGPKDISKLADDPKYLDLRNCGLRGSQIMRTRPIFHDWSLDFSLSYLPDMIDPAALIDMVKLAGQICALGTYRPRFGRFEVLNVK